MRTIGLAALLALGALGCASAGGGGPKIIGQGPILADELRRVGDRDTYTAIALLRPQFLQRRGITSFSATTPTEPEVFVDGMYYGPLASLRQLPSGELAEIRLLNVGDAAFRYGTGHTAGVIDIRSRH